MAQCMRAHSLVIMAVWTIFFKFFQKPWRVNGPPRWFKTRHSITSFRLLEQALHTPNSFESSCFLSNWDNALFIPFPIVCRNPSPKCKSLSSMLISSLTRIPVAYKSSSIAFHLLSLEPLRYLVLQQPVHLIDTERFWQLLLRFWRMNLLRRVFFTIRSCTRNWKNFFSS